MEYLAEYFRKIHLVVATEVRCRSVMSNEVETLLKLRFPTMVGAAEEKRGINCSRGDDKQPIAQRVRKVARNRANTTVRRSASM